MSMSTILNGIYQNAPMTEAQIAAGDNLDREQVIVTDFQENGVIGNDANKWDYLIGYQYQTNTLAGCIRRNLATMEGLSSTNAYPLSGASKVFIDNSISYKWITGAVDWSSQKAFDDLDAGLTIVSEQLSAYVFTEQDVITALNAGKLILFCGAPITLTGTLGQYKLTTQVAVEVYGEPIIFNATSLNFNCIAGSPCSCPYEAEGQINFYNDVYVKQATTTLVAGTLPCTIRFRNLYGITTTTTLTTGPNISVIYELARNAFIFNGSGTSTNSFWDNTVNVTEFGMKHLKDASQDGSIVSSLNNGTSATIVSGVSTIVLGSADNINTSGDYNVISGGMGQIVETAGYSLIGGGYMNLIYSPLGMYHSIGAGYRNEISINGSNNSIANAITSGMYNTVMGGGDSTITGGIGNFISSALNTTVGINTSSIIGGRFNGINNNSNESIIIGGESNFISSEYVNTVPSSGINTTINTISAQNMTLSNNDTIIISANFQYTGSDINASLDAMPYLYETGSVVLPTDIYYVVNLIPNLTFQISKTPSGTPLTLTTPNFTGGHAANIVISKVTTSNSSGVDAIISSQNSTIDNSGNSLILSGRNNLIKDCQYITIDNGDVNSVTASGYSSIYSSSYGTIEQSQFSSIIDGEYNTITQGNMSSIIASSNNILGANTAFSAIIGSNNIPALTNATNAVVLGIDGSNITNSGAPSLYGSSTVSVSNLVAINYISAEHLHIPNNSENGGATIHGSVYVFGPLGVDGDSIISGDVQIGGNLSKTSGTFRIPFPTEEKKDKYLYHSFVESPTAGDNIYTYKVYANKPNDVVSISLPDYWTSLNDNPRIFVQGVNSFARAYATIDYEENTLIVTCESASEFDVLVIGTRKDPSAKRAWKGVERDI